MGVFSRGGSTLLVAHAPKKLEEVPGVCSAMGMQEAV